MHIDAELFREFFFCIRLIRLAGGNVPADMRHPDAGQPFFFQGTFMTEEFTARIHDEDIRTAAPEALLKRFGSGNEDTERNIVF